MSNSVQTGRVRRGRRAIAEINVVPYIDVMLVLLIIFMVTAPFVNPAVVNLPSVSRSSLKPSVLPVEVVIKADGALSLRIREPKTSEFPVDRARMVAEILQRQASNPDLPVVISADKAVRYEIVLQVMDELNRNNVRRVGLTVKPAS
jgi:biopolymer transport protein TolR